MELLMKEFHQNMRHSRLYNGYPVECTTNCGEGRIFADNCDKHRISRRQVLLLVFVQYLGRYLCIAF